MQEIVPQIELDPSRCHDDRLPGKVAEDAGNKGKAHDDAGDQQEVRACERVVLDAAFQFVHGAADEERLHDREDIGAHDRKNSQKEGPAVTPQIGP